MSPRGIPLANRAAGAFPRAEVYRLHALVPRAHQIEKSRAPEGQRERGDRRYYSLDGLARLHVIARSIGSRFPWLLACLPPLFPPPPCPSSPALPSIRLGRCVRGALDMILFLPPFFLFIQDSRARLFFSLAFIYQHYWRLDLGLVGFRMNVVNAQLGLVVFLVWGLLFIGQKSFSAN